VSLYKQIQTENPTPLIGVERGGGPQLSGARPPAGLPVSRALRVLKINLEEISNKYYFSNMLHLTAPKKMAITIAHISGASLKLKYR